MCRISLLKPTSDERNQRPKINEELYHVHTWKRLNMVNMPIFRKLIIRIYNPNKNPSKI